MELFNNHKTLYRAALLFFVSLTVLVAVLPAWRLDNNRLALPNSPELTPEILRGKAVFIANGCVACHTQQVRNVAMDKVWGDRPGIAADYARIRRTDTWRNTATLMGTERTGPDLTNVGQRQPSREWNLTHLYNPRILVSESIMPPYPWLFSIKESVAAGDVVVPVPEQWLPGGKGKLVAGKDALDLIAYLQSLRQVPLPDGRVAPEFLYNTPPANSLDERAGKAGSVNGAQLYTTYCQSCHQENGEGLSGAFPPLKGSSVVLNDDPKLMIDIIMNGYSGRVSEGFGEMPAIGTLNNLSAEEIAAIMNHERTSWGNQARQVTPEEVKSIMELVKQSTPKQ